MDKKVVIRVNKCSIRERRAIVNALISLPIKGAVYLSDKRGEEQFKNTLEISSSSLSLNGEILYYLSRYDNYYALFSKILKEHPQVAFSCTSEDKEAYFVYVSLIEELGIRREDNPEITIMVPDKNEQYVVITKGNQVYEAKPNYPLLLNNALFKLRMTKEERVGESFIVKKKEDSPSHSFHSPFLSSNNTRDLALSLRDNSITCLSYKEKRVVFGYLEGRIFSQKDISFSKIDKDIFKSGVWFNYSGETSFLILVNKTFEEIEEIAYSLKQINVKKMPTVILYGKRNRILEKNIKGEIKTSLSLITEDESNLVILESLKDGNPELESRKDERLKLINAFSLSSEYYRSVILNPQALLYAPLSYETKEFQTFLNSYINGKKLSQKKKSKLNKVILYILERYNEDINISLIAKSVGISSSKLSSLFKSVYGVSITKWLALYRIYKAKLLIKETKMSLSEIAKRVGLKDGTRLSKTFDKYDEKKPIDYKKVRKT